MTEDTRIKPYDPIDTLARSLFGFALVAWIPMVITWILFVMSPVSPDAIYAQIRFGIIGGFGLLTLLGLGVLAWLFRHQPSELKGTATLINQLLAKSLISIILILFMIEINLIALLTLTNIAPPITNPIKFLMICWTILLFGLIFTVNWAGIESIFNRTQGLWISIGVTVIVIIFLGGLYLLTSNLISASGMIGRLQGSLDYRPLEFIDDEKAPTPQQFWAEQGQLVVRWLPYNYWTVAPFEGEYINIDSQGVRYTPVYSDDKTAQKIYFFGGSTMWGEGARDAYTIPGHIAKLLADKNQAKLVTNYGQTGYVSEQDMILFQAQLALDNIPDIAVFYQGFNDIYSAYLQDTAGIPYRENQRVSDVEAGRMLRSGQPVLRLPDGDISTYDWSLVGTGSATAESIANRWIANLRITQAIADAYGVKIIFVWQPALFAKGNLTVTEQVILDELEVNNPDFIALYIEVDNLIRQTVSDSQFKNIIVMTDLFETTEGMIFHDLVHITEVGNLEVANAILPALIDLLEK